ncbi:MAG: AAA family ATPase, partial [Lachnospiraceae bacterium]|nr:AAA family ATPase [Lachnospiraceae bacterium]
MAERKLPVGIQSFEKLITEGFIYVDKTDHIYRLVHNNVPYFLCRPRRFGKSLLLSTIKAYWEGKKELFSGLKIADMEKENPDPWREYQVFYFDFNGADYRAGDALEGTIDFHLRNWENKYGTFREGDNLAERFQLLLKKAYEVTGLRSVILVDEYDKPLLDTLDDPELKEHNRAVFKSFFSVLKGLDEYIQFSLITGVTKFDKVSIFSDLNNLEDISADSDYANVCGLTEDEITTNFGIELNTLAEQYGVGAQECLMRLKRMYDGYCFSSDTHLKVYNPYSVLTALKKRKFGAYWFETGTPSFLVKKLKDSCFDVKRLTDKTIYANERLLADYRADSADFVPLLYQTGYLTIIDYDKTGEFYTLGLPNEEVEYALMESLMPEYVSDYGAGTGKDILTLRRYV